MNQMKQTAAVKDFLTAPLPEAVSVAGRQYPVRWDFRTGILLSELFSDGRILPVRRGTLALRILSPALAAAVDRGEVETSEGVRQVLWFYTCGREDGSTEKKSGSVRQMAERWERSGKKDEIFDFAYDSGRILAAFQQVYGLDLTVERIHWWRFFALLRSLPTECALMRVIQLRMMDVSKIEDDAVRRQVRRAKAAVRIPKREKEGREIG